MSNATPTLEQLFPPNPDEIRFTFNLVGTTADVSAIRFYGHVLEKITEVINKEEKTNFQVYFIGFDKGGLKFSVKGQNVVEFNESYNFLIKQSINQCYAKFTTTTK